MPERIIEGDALNELERVPQLVSGSTETCLQVAYDYSKEIFQNVIKLQSLEEGEIIKLASNSYRSLNFAFSNEISRISNLYGLSGSELIKKQIMVMKEIIFLNLVWGLVVFVYQKIPYYFQIIQKNYQIINLEK